MIEIKHATTNQNIWFKFVYQSQSKIIIRYLLR